MNLFEQSRQNSFKEQPLAYRMRPRDLDELFGQEELVGPGKLLRRAIEADRVQSLIFYGPPGTGKTSLAQIIARKTKADFFKINAVTSGVKELRELIKKARDNLHLHSRKTILFIDEIHRFNKSQQDALLPAVEEGLITMIGATTENPYFEINSPLLSRARIFQLKSLSEKDIMKVLTRALQDKERGLGNFQLRLEEGALEFLARMAGGDARRALNALELAVLTTPPNAEGFIPLSKKSIADSLQTKVLHYDKDGDNHYDTISALIKSIRGSDPDAALLWLAKMIEAGEDPRFIARRLIVHAAEDIGLADPRALQLAVAAAQAVEYVGLPEARIPLAEAVIYLAATSKSNSVIQGIDGALNYVRHNPDFKVPLHLRDAHYQGVQELGHGKGYLYPHDYPGHYVQQSYLPDEINGLSFYKPSEQGEELKLKESLEKRRGKLG